MKKCCLILIVLLLCIPLISCAENSAGTADDHEFDMSREIASFMETHYDVSILIGAECRGIATDSFTIGDKPEGRTPFKNIMGLYSYTEEIQLIDDAFSIYPPGFFDKFICDEAPKGLRILLADQILYEGQSMAGVTTVEDGYYNVFLGVGAFRAMNVHHEIWHAMEFRITAERPDAFAGWNDLNPPGFQYSEDYVSQDIWEQAAPKDEWFVRGYSVIDEMEDRATVIEALLQYDEEWWKERPHIEDKLNYLLEAAEPVFGNVYYSE